jgi:hypothetical protein
MTLMERLVQPVRRFGCTGLPRYPFLGGAG